jgi:hypothetical protein
VPPSVKPLSVAQYLARWEELDSEKRPWLVHYQAIAEIFLTRKMDFTRLIIPGQFLQADVFDNTGQFALYQAASIFLSLMLPEAARTYEIRPARRLRGVPGIEEYFRYVTEEMHEVMDQPKAGLQMAAMEHFIDTLAFGVSGIGTFENPDESEPEVPVLYDSWGVKSMCISETAQGYVDTVYYKRKLKVRQLVLEYSREGDRIPPAVQEKFDNRDYDHEVEVLIVIEPKTPEPGKRGIAGMRVRTVHIAPEHKFRMRVGGYEEMPVAVGRQFKTLDEALGRSSAMLALPDAQSLNALTEAVLVAAEKQLDPPLVVLDSGRLGGGVVDTSAGALNVYDAQGRLGNEKPIQALFTVGELNSAKDQQEQLKNKIMQAFFLDRLLDLNNQTQMTAYETSVRDRMRGEVLGGIFSRQEKEVWTPTIHRTFNVLFRKGYLGIIQDGVGAQQRRKWDRVSGAGKMVVPPAVTMAHRLGLDVFEVEYVSPAKRFQRGEKLQGLMRSLDAIIAAAGSGIPQLVAMADGIDPDKTRRDIYELNGAPITGLRTDEETLKFRAANSQQRQAKEQLDAKEQASNVALKAAQAKVALGTAPAPSTV